MANPSITEQLREVVESAIERGAVTRYSLAALASIEYKTLARWLDEGRDIRLSTVSALCEVFGMRLTKPKDPKQ